MKALFLHHYPGPTDTEGSSSHTISENTDTNKTDNSQLVLTPNDYPVYVSPDGGATNEPFPEAGVEYDFCTSVANAGNLSSGPFLVKFTISGDDGSEKEFTFEQEAGLEPQATVLAVVNYGSFPNEFINYTLTACIYSPSAPESPINNCGSFDFSVNTK